MIKYLFFLKQSFVKTQLAFRSFADLTFRTQVDTITLGLTSKFNAFLN